LFAHGELTNPLSQSRANAAFSISSSARDLSMADAALMPLAGFQYVMGNCEDTRIDFFDGAFLWPLDTTC
jgi:hypothetical protein